MNRRDFLKTTGASLAATAAAGSPKTQAAVKRRKDGKLLNAYYFRAQMYTLVPHQIREDLKWMQDVGTQAVSVAIVEQDFFAAVENIEIVCNEATKLGMDVYAVPSRWAGLFAGAPKVPSLFSVLNPQTWVLQEDGTPKQSSVTGVISSIHYPETREFFHSKIDEMYKLWDLAGVFWDEPKLFGSKDFSPRAVEKLGRDAPVEEHVQAFGDFLTEISKYSKTNHPDKRVCMFAQAHYDDWKVDIGARVDYVDDFGCDGRPWYNHDGGKQEAGGKVLLGADGGERFLAAARKYGRRPLWLIENHNMALADLPVMDKRLPEILKKDVEHLLYYYYPRNLEDPDRIMKVVAKHMRNWV